MCVHTPLGRQTAVATSQLVNDFSKYDAAGSGQPAVRLEYEKDAYKFAATNGVGAMMVVEILRAPSERILNL